MGRLADIQASLDRAALTPTRQRRRWVRRRNLTREQRGRRRWGWLHLRLARPINVDERPHLWAKITRLAEGLGGCSCSSHWSGLLAANPIDWSDPEAWGVRVHNLVNAKLGGGKRSDWTVEQARQDARPRAAAP